MAEATPQPEEDLPPDDDALDDENLDLDDEPTPEEEKPLEEEAPAEAPPEPVPAVAEKPPSRAARRIQSLAERVRRQEEELAEIRNQRRQPDNTAAQEAQRQREEQAEREALESMDPARISRFYTERVERRSQAQIQQVALNSADIADKAAFQSMCAMNPAMARWADRVEARLGQLRNQSNWGQNPQRVALWRYMMGEDMEKKLTGAVTRQTRRAETEVRRQTTRPATSRGSIPSSGSRSKGSEQEERARRLDESGEL